MSEKRINLCLGIPTGSHYVMARVYPLLAALAGGRDKHLISLGLGPGNVLSENIAVASGNIF